MVRPVKLLFIVGALLLLTGAPAHAAPLKVHWLRGFTAPGTPARPRDVFVSEPFRFLARIDH